MPKFRSYLVRVPCDCHRNDDREDPRRGTEQESGYIGQAERTGECRLSGISIHAGFRKAFATHEIRVERQADCVGDEGQREDVDFVVFDGH